MAARICIIIPCFNEASRFKNTEFREFVNEVPDVDLCFVDDGSTDDTLQKMKELQRERPERIRVVAYFGNKGKAEAVRQGVLRMLALREYQWLAFADADLATPLSEVLRLIRIARQESGVMMVMGARIERMGVTIHRKFYRHFTGRIFAAIVSLLFRLNAYDTQCGAKVFQAEMAGAVFEQPFVSHWLFDVEILLRARKLYRNENRIIREIPLDIWLEQGHSKIRFSHLLKMPCQLCRIYFKYRC
ncbi:MAG: glycosyltransferase [Odoribacter sp.]|nr:glycosyltransferase [Odoribacter sp.]